MPKNKLKPIRVFYSHLSQRFYASRAWKVVKTTDDRQIVEITGEQFDVTNDIAALVLEHDITFSRPVLGGVILTDPEEQSR